MERDTIKARLEAALDEAKVSVQDLTGGGDHFQVTIISPSFEGLGLIDQHQLVYKALKVEVSEEIHALTLKTYTPEQWEKTARPNPMRGRLPIVAAPTEGTNG